MRSKTEIRRELLAARRALGPAELQLAAERLVAVAARAPLLVEARTVASYAAVAPEPETGLLTRWFEERRVRVLLPVLHDDNDLGWGETGAGLVPGRFGLSEPAVDLGVDAVRGVDVVLCPALAVDRDGVRLGRGGGSYDRALARVPVVVAVVAVVYDSEVVESLPKDAHDQRVSHVLTPGGLIGLG